MSSYSASYVVFIGPWTLYFLLFSLSASGRFISNNVRVRVCASTSSYSFSYIIPSFVSRLGEKIGIEFLPLGKKGW